VSFGELTVFVYRARQKKLAGNANAAVSPPPPCLYSAFNDVPWDHIFCPYITSVTNTVGPNARSPLCLQGYFCPDVVFSGNTPVSGIPVRRGSMAFYLVKGILDADNPHSLPTSNGQLPFVTYPGAPADCGWESISFVNMIQISGSLLRGWSYTSVVNATDMNFWSLTTAATLKGNTAVKSSGSATGFSNEVTLPWHTFDAAKNYEHPVQHQVASACLPSGSINLPTQPWPILLSVNQTVLYRGMNQAVSFRGTTLQGTSQATLNSVPLSTSVSNATQFSATASFITPVSTPAGPAVLGLLAQYNGGPAQAAGLPVTVADPTPFISSVCAGANCASPLELTSGTQVTLTVSGSGFGSDPILRVGTLLPVVTGSSSTSITASLTIPAGLEEIGDIYVVSRGGQGTGFAPAPPPATPTTAQSNTKPFRAAALCTSLSMVEETVSPSFTIPPFGYYDAVAVQSIPPHNPASIRVGLDSTFEVSRTPGNCAVTWSVLGGQTIIIGSPYNHTVVVRGTSIGSATLLAQGTGTSVATSTTLPVRSLRFPPIPVRVRILTDSSGGNAATTIAKVNQDIATANILWSQAAISFELIEVEEYPSNQWLNPSSQEMRDQLRNLMQNTGGFEVYYVSTCPDTQDSLGIATPDGIVICMGASVGLSDSLSRRVLAHELGHGLGLADTGTRNLHLMAASAGNLDGDIRTSEVSTVYQLQQFSHN